jgi:hypothetical protein
MPAPAGTVGAVKTYDSRKAKPVQQRVLGFLRDNVHPDIPRAWYKLVTGHDQHLVLYATLEAVHYHATERDPLTGRMGWYENLGVVSQGKVTTAFRDFLSNQLRTDSTELGDFKFHEVGTSNTAEANTHTGLQTTTGIARVTGTQAGTAPDYVSVATVTADTSETWQEHGIFSHVSAGTMMDRSLISPTVSVVASDTVQFTYTLTMAAEA